MTDYLVYDVFTDTRFGGNQLAIFPDATGLPEADLQSIAREFNFSETTFVTPDESGAHRVRIFTPTMEVPFAGHPVIGTAVALADAGAGPEMTFALGIGEVAVRAADGAARFVTRAALEEQARPDPALAARALGLDPGQVAGPPVMASLGLPFVFVPLTDRAALSAITTDVAAFREGAAAYPSNLDFAIYAYVDAGETIHARMFAPLDLIPEDPATGSAAATLAALLTRDRAAPQSLTIRQGDDMGRPSVIAVTAEPGAVTVSGRAVRVMQGRLV